MLHAGSVSRRKRARKPRSGSAKVRGNSYAEKQRAAGMQTMRGPGPDEENASDQVGHRKPCR